MLLIGQPKSASTSLLKTLAKMFGISFQNGLGKKIGWEPCEGFSEIQKYHDTTIKRNYYFMETWIKDRQRILKEHILPTEHHKNLIKKIGGKVLILLRNPEDSFDNYMRLYKDYKEGKLHKAVINELMPYRFKKMHFFIFLQDLILFNKGWYEFDYDKKMIITFKDLILNYKKTIINIHHFWKYPVRKKILPLFKSKGNHGYNTYTGVGRKRIVDEVKK
jgi:hypothetical protein